MLLVVHRSGDSGSPRVEAATRPSSAGSSPGSESASFFRPPPGRRARPGGSAPRPAPPPRPPPSATRPGQPRDRPGPAIPGRPRDRAQHQPPLPLIQMREDRPGLRRQHLPCHHHIAHTTTACQKPGTHGLISDAHLEPPRWSIAVPRGLADYLPAGFPGPGWSRSLVADDGPIALPDVLFHDRGGSGTAIRTFSSAIMKYLVLARARQSHLSPQAHSPRISGALLRDHVIVDIYPPFPAGYGPRSPVPLKQRQVVRALAAGIVRLISGRHLGTAMSHRGASLVRRAPGPRGVRFP